MQSLLLKAIPLLLGMLTPSMVKKVADMILDFIEDKVLGSASEVDDKIVLPVCDLIREAFNIPDDD